MAIEVRQVKRCDHRGCTRTSETDRVRTFRIGYGGDRTKPAELDLCDEHAKPFEEAMKVARREKRPVRRAVDEMDQAARRKP